MVVIVLYINYTINLPDDGIHGARVIQNTSSEFSDGETRAFSEQAYCNSCSYGTTQHSVGDFDKYTRLWEDFWFYHKRDSPDCSENREVITFVTPLIRQQEKELEEFEDVQVC